MASLVSLPVPDAAAYGSAAGLGARALLGPEATILALPFILPDLFEKCKCNKGK